MDQSINDSKFHIWNSFLEYIFFGHTTFLFVHTFQWKSLEFFFFNFRFSGRKSQSQQKRSLMLRYSLAQNLTHFMNLKLLAIEKICSHNAVKSLSDFANFPGNMFLFGVRKSICSAPFLDVQELHY